MTLTGDSSFDGDSPQLVFETVGTNVPELVIAADLSIESVALVVLALGPNTGIIRSTGGHTLTFDGEKNNGPHFSGSFDFRTNLVMNGGNVVAAGDEVVNLGYQSAGEPSIAFKGNGAQFDIAAGGELHIGVVNFLPPGVDNQDWNAQDDGLIEIGSVCSGCANFRGSVLVTGTLEVNADLCTPEELSFFAGRIDVADGVSASFAAKCAE